MQRLTWLIVAAVAFFGCIWALNTFLPHTRLLMQFPTLESVASFYAVPPARERWETLSVTERLADINCRVRPFLETKLAVRGMRLGSPVFLRLFKETRELEIWLQGIAGDWKFLNSYSIACLSGNLGPKQREGDMQAPEGFYTVTPSQLNPASRYHLAFNIGYPNAYDLHHQRTGSHIMVHGDEVSIGCYAMTDVLIEEIYLLVSSAIEQGQREVSVHCFPFRFTTERMQQAQSEPWSAFWLNLREGFDAFEKSGKPPEVLLRDGRYVFR